MVASWRRHLRIAFPILAIATAVAIWWTHSVPPTLPKRVVLRGETDLLLPIAFSPDGSILAARDGRSWVTLWDVATGRLLHTIRPPILYGGLKFSPDGRYIAWELQGGESIRGPLRFAVAEAATGQVVGRCSREAEGTRGWSFTEDSKHLRFAALPDAWYRQTAGEPPVEPTWDVVEWDFLQDRITARRRFDEPDAWLMGISEESTPHAEINRSGSRCVVFPASGGRPMELRNDPTLPPKAQYYGGPWSPLSRDGRSLVLGRSDGRVSIWDVSSRSVDRVTPLFNKRTNVHLLQIAGGVDRAAAVGTERGKPWAVLAFEAAESWLYGSTRIRPDPTSVVVWDFATGRVLGRVEVRRPPSAVLSPDGRSLALGDDDSPREVTIWAVPE